MSDLTVTPLMSFLERAARDPDFDLVKFEAMLRLQREMERDQQQRAFNTDMALVQGEIGAILRTGKNPSFTNPYARLEDLDRAARQIYTSHGFTVRYGSALSGRDAPPIPANHTRMVLIISHRDGYVEEHHLDGPLDTQMGARGRTPIQAVGSTVTYLRRYLLQMVLNLVPASDPVDDDGEGTRRGGPTNDGGDSRREEINREVPMNGQTDPWEIWLDRLDATVAKLSSREGWDALWANQTVIDNIKHLPGDHRTLRLDEIRARHAKRIFPTDAEKKEAGDGQ